MNNTRESLTTSIRKELLARTILSLYMGIESNQILLAQYRSDRNAIYADQVRHEIKEIEETIKELKRHV